ncbi:MAG: DUF3256 family protein [Phocaeicola sp.]
MKHLFTLLLCMVATCSLPAQEMKQLFIELPDSIAPLLTKVNREDCVDFLDSNMKAEVKNRFGKPSELKQLTADYLLLQTTEQSSLQLKLLPLNDSVKVICAIFTACAPACDSEVRFYTTDWKRLNRANFLSLPVQEQFFLAADSAKAEFVELQKQLDMNLYQVAAVADKHELLVHYATIEYLSKEERSKIEPYLQPEPLRYVWSEGRFTLWSESSL